MGAGNTGSIREGLRVGGDASPLLLQHEASVAFATVGPDSRLVRLSPLGPAYADIVPILSGPLASVGPDALVVVRFIRHVLIPPALRAARRPRGGPDRDGAVNLALVGEGWLPPLTSGPRQPPDRVGIVWTAAPALGR